MAQMNPQQMHMMQMQQQQQQQQQMMLQQQQQQQQMLMQQQQAQQQNVSKGLALSFYLACIFYLCFIILATATTSSVTRR